MDRVKVSVTIPVYNCQKYISDCISSVLNQTMKDFEIVVVDDGSTDDTISIIESFNDSRIHIYKQNHGGEACARNFAMDKCSGEYIALLDSDDMMVSDRLEFQSKYMDEHPMTDIITGTMYYIDENNNNIGGFDDTTHLVTIENLSQGNPLSNPAAFIRRDTLIKRPISYETDGQYFFAPDYKFWCTALMSGYKIEIVSKKCTNYRKHGDQLTSKKAQEQIRCANNIKRYISENYGTNSTFITFSNSNSNFSFDRIKYEAESIGSFSNVICYTEKDFDSEYWEKYKDHFIRYARGYGYWAWKPYFIKKTLEECNDGDVVVYADTGCMILKDNKPEMDRWIHIASSSESGILSPCFGPYIEHDWSRGDLYEYINETYNKNNVDIFDKAIQCGAGILVVCKKPRAVDFINQWNDIMSEHFNLCTDEQSTKPNHPNFHENRHDQSAFSMLSKIYGIETIETKYGILDKEKSPIICTRCKGDKYTWKKPISVLYDNQIYDLQKFGGISRMYVDLHNEHDKNEIVDNFTGNGVARGSYAKVSSKFSVLNTQNEYLKGIYPYSKQVPGDNTQYTLKNLSDGNFDIFYPTFFNPYFLPYLNGKTFVMSIHDMIPELYPEFFPRNDMQIVGKKVMAEKASMIEVPTETTKRDVMKILGVDENKIRIIGRALPNDFGNNSFNKSLFDFDYILYVGQRNAYKRFDWFIKHVSKYVNANNIHVVCTGSDFNDREKTMFNSLGVNDKIHHIFANDQELSTLYKFAKCFIYSSEYEGFGMPILESYKMGCIALLNDNNCFREVTFNKGIYFKLTENESNISEVVDEVVNISHELKAEILKIQYAILSNYSWKKTSDKLISMFEDALVNKKASGGIGYSNDDTDIFICAHKNFDVYPKNDTYKLIDGGEDIDVDLDEYIDSDTKISPMEFSYAEGSRMYWVWKNYDLKDYVGFCHYRKYFDFFEQVPNIKEIFNEHDVILTSPINCGNLFQQYGYYHNINDIIDTLNIVKSKYNNYYPAFIETLNSNIMFSCNMFIMKKEDFCEYCDFVFGVLGEFTKLKGFKTDGDIKKHVRNNKNMYLKNFYPNDTVDYQARILGFLLERLTNVYVRYKFKNPKCYNILETSTKYNNGSGAYEK